MTDPVAFAEARLAEEEAAARAMGAPEHGSWRYDPRHGYEEWPGAVREVTTGATLANCDDEGIFIARYDPARALREVEAGRRILERHRPDSHGCQYCERWLGPEPCPDFADLLTRWADHPDYDQEWKP